MLICFYSTELSAQVTAAPTGSSESSAVLDALGAIQPTLASVSLAVSSVDVHRWKAPGDVKDTTIADAQSIERDLAGTLPALVIQAQAAPDAISPTFAVYRNIDALYDVLLRVTETATLAGSQQEAAHLESARADLQLRRSQLGNALLSSSSAQDTNISQLRTSLAAARSTQASSPTGVKKIVVNDGPDAPSTKAVRKKKPAATKPAENPAPANQPAPQ